MSHRISAAALASIAVLAGAAGAQDACGLGGLCQAPDGADVWLSNSTTGFMPLQADAFSVGADAALSRVCFWGIAWDGAQNCTAADVFTVTYFNDDAGGACPGSLRAGPYEVTATRVPTGASLGGSALEYRWSATHPELLLTAGERCWIGIANADPSCFFWWETSADADGTHCERRDGRDEVRPGDLAFCVDVAGEDCPAEVAAAVADRATHRGRGRLGARLLASATAARDVGLARSATGRRWLGLYYRHAPEMTRLLRERPRLRRRATLLLAVVADDLADGARGAGTARIPSHAVALLHGVLDGFAEGDASPALRRAVGDERAALAAIAVPGASYADAWRQLDARGR